LARVFFLDTFYPPDFGPKNESHFCFVDPCSYLNKFIKLPFWLSSGHTKDM
jgi:hypothetical protein